MDTYYNRQNPDPWQKLLLEIWVEITLTTTELQTLLWYLHNNFIVLAFDNADKINFLNNITT